MYYKNSQPTCNRRNDAVIGLLKYLENPGSIKKKETDPIFKVPPKNELEQLAKSLLKRLFGESADEKEDEDNNQDTEDDEDISSSLDKAMAASGTKKKAVTTKDAVKSLSKQMKAFELTGDRSRHLEMLYQALLNVCPKSVACERTFSISGNFVSA